MSKKLECIMLVDDNEDDNFFHERAIKKVSPTNIVITKNSGNDALEYLKSKQDPRSELIFLDINMPRMNGWEFLDNYNRLDKELQCQAIIVMLTTSDNSDDLEKSKKRSIVSDYITKPLTEEKIQDIIDKYFK